MISSIEYNTDGKDNVMAHTVPDTEDTNDDKFRLAIDTNDIVDSNGKLTLDGKETIVHEFVSDYAATNIEEDIAESFRIFVCGEKPTTLSVADKKVLFFYDYPELVKIRNEYRNNL